MSDPRHTMWHEGKEVAAGTREAMLAAGRLMLWSKPPPIAYLGDYVDLHAVSSHVPKTVPESRSKRPLSPLVHRDWFERSQAQLSEAVAISRRQSAEIDNLKEQVLTGDIVRTNLRSDVERVCKRLKEVEWTAHVCGDCGCPFCGADKYTADGEQGEHFYDCPAFTVDGVVK